MFGKIADLGLVVQCHCGGDICWSDLNAMCGPREIEKLVKNVRGLKFVAAHLGGCFGYEPHATDALRECGVYIDTAMLSSRRHYDEEVRILRSWPKERILFGTDFPWAHYAECIENVKLVREKADWEALFSGNAIKLLGD
jgi:predicted TIM-barrel fold metal-dependent hydrolase